MFIQQLRKFSKQKVLNINSLSSCVKNADYAVRGDVVLKAAELEQKLIAGHKYPFKELTACNIGNPHYLGQKPLTWIRQGLSLLINPELLTIPSISSHYPSDILERVKYLLSRIKGGVGAYSESQGLLVARESVAKYIENRDQLGPSNPADLFMTSGASPSVEIALACSISSPKDGIMIPIPQYPLYNALITLKNGQAVGYFMDSSDNYWKLSIEEMQKALDKARNSGINTKAMVVINPGNPTAQVLSLDNMKKIVEFCEKNNLVLLADEVYQDNIYDSEKKFHSFRKIVKELKTETELFSFHSFSKGFAGECGIRGGYVEVLNIDPAVKSQILKLSSIMLCSTTIGQLGMELLLNPPKPNQPSYNTFIKEKTDILEALKRKSKLMYELLNDMENIHCNHVEGAMYALPSVTFSNKAIAEAKKNGMEADKFYVLQALEETGIVLVPGSGFGQRPGTYHFRITVLSSENTFKDLLLSFKEFNSNFHKKYKD